MNDNEKERTIPEAELPADDLDEVSGGISHRQGSKTECMRCGRTSSTLSGGYCNKCLEEVLKEGKPVLL